MGDDISEDLDISEDGEVDEEIYLDILEAVKYDLNIDDVF